MNLCKQCSALTKNAMFCSSSCSAKYNNPLKAKKPLPACKQCGREVKHRARSYCSQRCQFDFQSNQRLTNWLETGFLDVVMIRVGDPIRSYILEDQHGHCALCPQVPLWQGKSLVFILDHVDGDSSDNSRTNLRLVCPNCNSQLDTFTSKNKGRGRHWRRERYVAGKSA